MDVDACLSVKLDVNICLELLDMRCQMLLLAEVAVSFHYEASEMDHIIA